MKNSKYRLKAILDYRKKKITVGSFPPVLHVELTNACNLKCVICPHIRMRRSIGYMTLELVDKIIKETSGKSEFATLHAWGESLLHPQFDTIIRKFKKNGFKTQMSTNATILNKEQQEKLVNSDLDLLIFSIDAANEETYNKIRIGGDFKKTIKNIEDFLILVKKQKVKMFCVFQLVYNVFNKEEAILFKKKWEMKYPMIYVCLKPYSVWSGEDKSLEKYYPGDVVKCKENLCDWIWRVFIIHWNGNVVPCCNDYDGKVSLGNVTQSSIDEIWNGDKIKEFRYLHLNGRNAINLCKNCNYQSLGSFKQLVFILFSYFKSLKFQILFENYFRNLI